MSAIYIHIPFCKQKCIYCNFYSVRTDSETLKLYVDGLLKEIELRKNYLFDKQIETIYFGGGTPSLLDPVQINQILNKIAVHFDISFVDEITMEANPDCLSVDYLKQLKENTPINRLSIGVQSFFDDDLRFLNRKHSAEQSIQSIKTAQDIGFHNLSIDLIYGLPSLSCEKWTENLHKCFNLNIPHISAYALTVEPNTALDTQIRKGKTPELDEEQMVKHFHILTSLMETNGYEQYEISNFAKQGMYSKHNSSYWNRTPYLGLGASAHSFDGHSRQWNVADVHSYLNSLQNNALAFEREELSFQDNLNEYLMTGLRTSSGINKAFLDTHFEEAVPLLKQNIDKYIQRKLIVEDEHAYKLTLEGKLFADRIAGELFV